MLRRNFPILNPHAPASDFTMQAIAPQKTTPTPIRAFAGR
jgi:hypothetical protein